MNTFKFVLAGIVENKKLMLGFQALSLTVTLAMLIVWAIVEKINPDFFNYPYWYNTDNFFESVAKFWPLFVWGGLMAFVGYSKNWVTSHDAETIFKLDVATSVMAGLWEEIGFRCVYILTAMIGICFANFCWKWTIVISLIITVIYLLVSLAKAKVVHIILSLIMLGIFGGFAVLLWHINDPIYWVYQNITFPVINFITLHQFEHILYSGSIPFLFVAGAISANAKFRDGHKYQGPKGLLNSWVIGMVLINAMINHGLVIAIVIHAIYDLEFAFVRYFFAKSKH
jgi:hypothetical protein